MATGDVERVVSLEEALLNRLHDDAINYLLPRIKEETMAGTQKFANVCQYLHSCYPPGDAQHDFGTQLRNLFVKALTV